MLNFYFNIKPKSCPRPRLSQGHTYMPKQYKEFKESLELLARTQMREQGFGFPISCPVKISVVFGFETPKSWSKKKAENAFYHSSKPDLDNLVKSVLDAFNGVVWTDDALVAEIHAAKLWRKDESFILAEVEIAEGKK